MVMELKRRARRGAVVLLALNAVAACERAAPTTSEGDEPQVPEGHGTVTVANAGLRTPSSILYDERADVYLVANAGGTPSDGDRTGFISRVLPNGRVETLRWIDGGMGGAELETPEGMAIRGDTLFVAAVDCVRLFHRVTGSPAGSVCPPDARSLSGLTVDHDGVLWASDGGGSESAAGKREGGAIFAIGTDGAARAVLRGEQLGHPRGIAASSRGVFFAGLESGSVSQVTPTGARRVVGGRGWRLDGIAFLPDGSFVFSNRSDSTVLFVRAKDGGARGEVFTLVRRLASAGALAYDTHRKRVLIPQPALDRLLFVDLWP